MITAGDPVMLIVPQMDTLLVEAKVEPKDIDQIQFGQPVVLRFSAFNTRTTPEINGAVRRSISRSPIGAASSARDLLRGHRDANEIIAFVRCAGRSRCRHRRERRADDAERFAAGQSEVHILTDDLLLARRTDGRILYDDSL